MPLQDRGFKPLTLVAVEVQPILPGDAVKTIRPPEMGIGHPGVQMAVRTG
jgi:hypothetical protein